MSLVYGVLAGLLVIFLLSMVIARKPLFGIGLSIVTVVLIAMAVFFYFKEDSRLENQRSRIPLEQIIFTDIHTELSYGNTYRIGGMLENRSLRYMLASILLDIRVLDCSAEKPEQNSVEQKAARQDCQLLQKKLHKVDTRMPAQTKKHIETYILFDALDENNAQLTWDVKVNSGIGR